MTLKEKQLQILKNRIIQLQQKERANAALLKRVFYRVFRWGMMLYHEIVRDDALIRAESLSYFTLFSILPVIAGIFLMLGVFSHWGPIQNEFQNLLAQMLQPIPDEHREDLLNFIIDFKDQYLAKITQQSTWIGFVALGMLFWIVSKVFFNIEDLMNHIWTAQSNRARWARIRNLVICCVVFPVFVVIAVSLPGLLAHFGGQRIGAWVNQGLPLLTVFFGLSFLFRYFPNVRVRWKSAFSGAAFGAFGFTLMLLFLKYYFAFGTSTAYGKAAVFPIVAFFIYVLWLIIILGAQMSFLIQNQDEFEAGFEVKK